jgi:hypothetical protein
MSFKEQWDHAIGHHRKAGKTVPPGIEAAFNGIQTRVNETKDRLKDEIRELERLKTAAAPNSDPQKVIIEQLSELNNQMADLNALNGYAMAMAYLNTSVKDDSVQNTQVARDIYNELTQVWESEEENSKWIKMADHSQKAMNYVKGKLGYKDDKNPKNERAKVRSAIIHKFAVDIALLSLIRAYGKDAESLYKLQAYSTRLARARDLDQIGSGINPVLVSYFFNGGATAQTQKLLADSLNIKDDTAAGRFANSILPVAQPVVNPAPAPQPQPQLANPLQGDDAADPLGPHDGRTY